MKKSNTESPSLQVLISDYQTSKVYELFEAIKEVNHCMIAYNALKSTFLFHKVSADIRYELNVDQIRIYSTVLKQPVAFIAFPNPVKGVNTLHMLKAA